MKIINNNRTYVRHCVVIQCSFVERHCCVFYYIMSMTEGSESAMQFQVGGGYPVYTYSDHNCFCEASISGKSEEK
jgi:hypothetical protein